MFIGPCPGVAVIPLLRMPDVIAAETKVTIIVKNKIAKFSDFGKVYFNDKQLQKHIVMIYEIRHLPSCSRYKTLIR